MKAAIIRGFADAEAHVDIRGGIVFTQKADKSGENNIKLIHKLLGDLGIKSEIFKKDGFLRLMINKNYLKLYLESIGFSSKRKMKDLKTITEIYDNSIDKRDIRNDIIKLAYKPITRREIVLKLKSKRDKTGLIIKELEKNGKIKIINKRPLTIISSKEEPHD